MHIDAFQRSIYVGGAASPPIGQAMRHIAVLLHLQYQRITTEGVHCSRWHMHDVAGLQRENIQQLFELTSSKSSHKAVHVDAIFETNVGFRVSASLQDQPALFFSAITNGFRIARMHLQGEGFLSMQILDEHWESTAVASRCTAHEVCFAGRAKVG